MACIVVSRNARGILVDPRVPVGFPPPSITLSDLGSWAVMGGWGVEQKRVTFCMDEAWVARTPSMQNVTFFGPWLCAKLSLIENNSSLDAQN